MLLNYFKYNSLIRNLILSVIFVFAIVVIFGSIYDTTDDLFMRSVILGNDLIQPSEKLIFSKCIYGYLILLFPKFVVFNICNYDFISMLLIGLALGLISSFGIKQAQSKFVNYFFNFVLFGIGSLFVIRPQFTNTAGLLAISSVVSIVDFFNSKQKRKDYCKLILGLILLVFAYWIRVQMALVIFFIALPLLFNIFNFAIFKKLVFPVSFLFSIMFLTEIIEYKTYNTNEYKIYFEKKKVILPFCDYQFGKKLLKPSNKDLFLESKLSKNDISLLMAFFNDWPKFDTLLPHIQNIQNRYSNERDYTTSRILSSYLSFNYLKEKEILFLVLAVFLILLSFSNYLNKDFIVILSMIILTIIVFSYYGFIQRGFLSRLYLTPIFALLIFSFPILIKNNNIYINILTLLFISIHISMHFNIHYNRLNKALLTRNEWHIFKSKYTKIEANLFFWGGRLDILFIQPVYIYDSHCFSNNLVKGVGSDLDLNRKSATNQLLAEKTINICSNKDFIDLYKVFFKERFDRDLDAKHISAQFDIYELRLN